MQNCKHLLSGYIIPDIDSSWHIAISGMCYSFRRVHDFGCNCFAPLTTDVQPIDRSIVSRAFQPLDDD